MAKVIEFYLRGSFPKKMTPAPIGQRGKLIGFPNGRFTAESKTEDIEEHDNQSAVLMFGCF
jgi:hypothetical protein